MSVRRRLGMSEETAGVLRSLHPHIKHKIKAALRTIMTAPDSGKALKDDLEGLRSFRVGKFRVVYQITGSREAIEIIAIGPRKTIYQETLRLIKGTGHL